MEKNKLEKKWARFKYLILSKDHKTYLKIRNYLKRDDSTMNGLIELLEYAINLGESRKDVINAYLHIWGHFKKKASSKEKNTLMNLIKEYDEKLIEKEKVLSYLKVLLSKYKDAYLENSLIFIADKEILMELYKK